MPRNRIELLQLGDFTGGLNLRRDAFLLGDTEVPECLDVDFDPRGGVSRRKSYRPWSIDLGLVGGPQYLMIRDSQAGVRQAVVSDGTQLKHVTSAGGAVTAIAAEARTPERAVTFRGWTYFHGSRGLGTLKWDVGGAFRYNHALAPAFNDTIATPTDPALNTGWMPPAVTIIEHQGHLWAANMGEGGTAYKNRVRWSHPNFPQDWRSFDAIDVQSGTGADEITALASFGDQLLVFKNDSIHVITGIFPTFSVQPLTQELGAISQEAVAVTEGGVYFFSWPDGVFRWNGKQFEWLFEPLYPDVQQGIIKAANSGKIEVGWANRKLYVAVVHENVEGVVMQDAANNYPNWTYVYDPSVGKNGAWTQYGVGLCGVKEWDPPAGSPQTLALVRPYGYIFAIDQGDNLDSTFPGTDVTSSLQSAYFRTRWVDAGVPAVKKKWKRPELVMKGGIGLTLKADVFRDYDAADSIRQFYVSLTDDDNDFILDDGLGGGTGVLANDDFSGGVGVLAKTYAVDRNELERGSPLGNSTAVSLRFSQFYSSTDALPYDTKPWTVDAITFKYIKRRIRS